MYAYIKGEIVHKAPEYLILENNGIGYKVMSSSGLMSSFPAIGETAKAYTYYYVREDQISLYGFPTQEELSMFELLLTVSGIGPKVACNITGSLNPGQFAVAVVSGDTRALTSVKGIGKKGAERMILELKDKLKGRDMAGDDTNAGGVDVFTSEASGSVTMEAVSALMVLGYSSNEAMSAIRVVNNNDISLEDLIRLSLKQLVKQI